MCWSDGNIGGDCTEFYIQDVEIGNLVRTLDKSLDCGFGLERIESFFEQKKRGLPKILSKEDILFNTIFLLLDEGIQPSNQKQGYLLRKLIRQQYREKHRLPSHSKIKQEIEKIEKIKKRLPQILQKHPNKPLSFYWDTFGIDEDMIKLGLKKTLI